MCGGAPDVPTPPERQDAKAPARDPRASTLDPLRRRRGYAALIRTAGAGGDLTPVSTTATAMQQKLGA